MNRSTGRALGAIEHLMQSIADILITPIGSRVMRREYGSLVPELIDQPDNGFTQIRLYAAVSSALMRWEPRIRVQSMKFSREPGRPGRVVVSLEGSLANRNGELIALQIPLPLGAA